MPTRHMTITARSAAHARAQVADIARAVQSTDDPAVVALQDEHGTTWGRVHVSSSSDFTRNVFPLMPGADRPELRPRLRSHMGVRYQVADQSDTLHALTVVINRAERIVRTLTVHHGRV